MNLEDKRYFFFSGKGGVGKTTIASAFSLKISEKRKTLLVSLDPSHSLSLVFEKEIGGKIKNIKENLFAVEIDIEKESENYVENLKKQGKKMLSSAVFEEIEIFFDLAKSSPLNLDFALLRFVYEITKEENFSAIVFDTAPSGYALKLIALPSLTKAWLEKLKNLRKEILFLERENPEEDEVLKAIEEKIHQTNHLIQLFRSEKTFFGIIVNPEPLSVEIGRKTLEELKSAGIKTDAIIVNKWNGEELPFSGKNVLVVKKTENPRGIENLKKLFENEKSCF